MNIARKGWLKMSYSKKATASAIFLRLLVLVCGFHMITPYSEDSSECRPRHVETDNGKIKIECSIRCPNGLMGETPIHYPGHQCAPITTKEYESMKNGVQFQCPLGRCNEDLQCEKGNLGIACWRKDN
uniref:Evasin n=1 Tax=Amblyomma triste TaxID=251400 RepID=A0A023G0T6_AMBTT